MANTGLLRLFFLGLVLCSSLARADQPDLLSSRSWRHLQKIKRSDQIVELAHTIEGSGSGYAMRNIVRGENPLISGTITLTGPANRLHDLHQLTSSWKIIGCTTVHKRKQSVLIYCTSPNPGTDCSEIFLGGTKHTIVKLPDYCGASPFGRVVKFGPTHRQLPKSERKLLGNQSVSVFELQFDYEFEKIPYKKGETQTKMHMEFSNLAGYTEHPDYGKLRSYNDWLSHVNSTIKSNKAAQSKFRNDVSVQNQNTIPIDHDFSSVLASLSQQCQGFGMTLSIAASGHMNGSISFGYYVSGTIIPTQIDQHYAYLNGNSEIETNITLGGLVQYTFTGVTIPVVPSVGLPGLSYPGLLTIGPYYEINFGLTGDIALDGTMNAVTGFSLPVVDISIGNSSDPQTNSQGTNFADVTLSDNLQLSAGLTVSLIPQLGVGVSVLNGVVNADVSLQPSAGFTAGGQININVTTGQPSDPCVELVGDITLNWVVGGKLGPWGAAVTGQIWGVQKTLWQQCFNKKRSLGLVSDDEWKIITENHRPPMRFGRTLDSLVCPAVNPFTNSP